MIKKDEISKIFHRIAKRIKTMDCLDLWLPKYRKEFKEAKADFVAMIIEDWEKEKIKLCKKIKGS